MAVLKENLEGQPKTPKVIMVIMDDVSIYVPESLLRYAPVVKTITGYMGRTNSLLTNLECLIPYPSLPDLFSYLISRRGI